MDKTQAVHRFEKRKQSTDFTKNNQLTDQQEAKWSNDSSSALFENRNFL